ncbi:hypothetical protein [uncultured Shewanella sp.]|uniref:lipopolysaccharide biosynthesis protein n=1 Tax=uncultured Shewanella sp. TaxID=173975 RepID=UPI00262EBF3A|nr:hypothetical protein [uncultured Shewanella sp.]
MRTSNTKKNIIYSFGNIVLITLLNIIYRTIFIHQLGIEYLGVNAALVNVITLLSLAEMGVAQSISYYLYKPLKDKDNNTISSWMSFFKKIYIGVGFFVLFVGFLLSFFIAYLIPVTTVSINELRLLLFLFVLSASITYFWGYKRTLIIADQKNYEIIKAISISQLIELLLKILILIYTQSMVATIVIQIVVKVFENIYINSYINKKYQTIFAFKNSPLSKESLLSFKVKIRSIFFHKIGDVFVNGTDNLIISALIGVSVLGVFSNYAMLIAMSTTIVLVIFNSITSSLGNLIADDSSKTESIFNSIQMISVWIFGLISISFYFLIQDFITLWIGNEYLLPNSTVSLMAVNFFFLGLRVPLNLVKTAAGAFEKDQYAPLVQGVLNLVISIALCKQYGIDGVLLGTLISVLIVPFWTQPYVVYKLVFNVSIFVYFKKLIVIFSLVSGSILFIWCLLGLFDVLFKLESLFLTIICKLTIILIGINLFYYMFFYNRDEFYVVKQKIYSVNGRNG